MTTAALSTPKDYAFCYHDMGFSLFVLMNPETGTELQLKHRKRPAVNWELYQIMRPSKIQIERWFAKNPKYNLALVMGRISGNAVSFDVDGPTASKRVEEQRMKMTSGLRTALDSTMMIKTGGGGMQIIFRVEGEGSIDDISQKRLWSDGKPHSEILMQGNEHYIIPEPSIHPNNNRYQWNGKEPQTITRQQLDEFIRLVGSSEKMQSRPQQTTEQQAYNVRLPQERALTTEEMQRLFAWLQPLYISGDRNFIVYHLSAAMRKDAGYPLEDTKNFFRLLCNASGYSDEDVDKTLRTVERTYNMPINEINGKTGLHEVIVASHEGSKDYEDRKEAYSRLCQILKGEPESPEDPDDEGDARDTSKGDGGDDDYHDRPGQWLSRQMNAEKDLDIITTVCNEVLRLHRFKTTSDTREVLYYQNGTYFPKGENRIHEELERLGGYYVSSHVRNEVIEHIKIRTLTNREEFDKDTHLVNVRNCIIDLRSGECLPHDPDKYLFLQQIPWDYKPDEGIRTPRKILDFLYSVMHPSDVPLVIEFLGYCLIKDCRFQKALMIAGPPDQGKSTFLDMCTIFFGRSNVASKTMHQLTQNRFATASLFGKLVNIFADLSSDRLKNIEMFKVLVAGDSISAERKFTSDFDFKPYAKLIFSSNLPPLPPEDAHDEDAFYKRWFVVSFNRRKKCLFCGAKLEIDRNLINRLTTEEEMSGLLYLVVKAAQRLLLKGGFTKFPTIEQTQAEYERKANPVKAWGEARCIFYEEYETDKDRLEQDYEEYCNRKKLPRISRVHLARELKRLFQVEPARKGPRGNRKHMWKGVGLRKDLRASGQLDLSVYGDTDELEEEEF